MSASTVIPYPRLTRRYVELKDRRSDARLRAAEETTAAQLAAEFLESVQAFSQFNADGLTAGGEFFPATRTDDHKNAKSDARTFGWAMSLKSMTSVPVGGG